MPFTNNGRREGAEVPYPNLHYDSKTYLKGSALVRFPFFILRI